MEKNREIKGLFPKHGNRIKTRCVIATNVILFAILLSAGMVFSFAMSNQVNGQLIYDRDFDGVDDNVDSCPDDPYNQCFAASFPSQEQQQGNTQTSNQVNDRDNDGQEDTVDLCPDDYSNECEVKLPGINAPSGIDYEDEKLQQEANEKLCENSAQVTAGVDYYECTSGSRSVTELPTSNNYEVGVEHGGVSGSTGVSVPQGVETTIQTSGDKSRLCNYLANQVMEAEKKKCLADPDNYDQPMVIRNIRCGGESSGSWCDINGQSFRMDCDQKTFLPWTSDPNFWCQYRDIGTFTFVLKGGQVSIIR